MTVATSREPAFQALPQPINYETCQFRDDQIIISPMFPNLSLKAAQLMMLG
jgi:Uma2 family endonuclease